jgi:hypothetical protein
VLAPSLRESIAEAVRAVPDGRRGQAGVAVTLDGVQFDLGYKATSWLDVGAVAGKGWRSGWFGGVRAGTTW